MEEEYLDMKMRGDASDDSHCFSGMHPINEPSFGFVQELTRSLSLRYSAISQRSASSLVGVGAGVRSRFLGRTLGEQRHGVCLIPAQFVRPFVKANNSD